MYFFGGGQDLGQDIVGADLQGEHGEQLKRSIAGGAAVFSVCGGYQLLGREYVPEMGDPILGLGAMDVTTRAGKVRFVGNLLAETDDGRMLIGFENHSGYTTLGPQAKPLGRVIAGFGNDGESGYEGCRVGRALGTYLHGPLLPRNPWLADWLLAEAAAHATGERPAFEPLPDELEASAHDVSAARAQARGGRFR